MVVHKIEDGIKRPASQRLQPRAGYDFLYLLHLQLRRCD